MFGRSAVHSQTWFWLVCLPSVEDRKRLALLGFCSQLRCNATTASSLTLILDRGVQYSLLQPRRHKIEEGAQLERQKPMTGVDKTDGPRPRLEFLQDNGERPGPHRIGDLVREYARDSDSRNRCIDSGLGRVDDEP